MKRRTPAVANFDLVARPYRWMEYLTFGRSLERCRFHLLPRLTACRHAAVFGDGDGRFLARLLSACAELHADAVDTSAAMLQLLQQRVGADSKEAAARLRVHRIDALTFVPAQPCDLIVTHFFLDCLTQPEVDCFVRRLGGIIQPGALWVVSDFRIPPGAMRLPARILVRSLYLAFKLLAGLRTSALPNHADALNRAGFRLTEQRLSLAGVLTSELWEYTPAILPTPTVPHLLDPAAPSEQHSPLQ